ncbi:MAG: hypothetical protein IKP20_01340 [Candidatus Methanomethylophilaceae archaeon]|jgi:hypothetical protein|nr:hypothetical protein [Candidatus Methanomethylophilaceae archaeon]
MAFKLFKDGNDRYEEGNEYIKRGDFSKARSSLQKSLEKEGGADDVAAVQIALIDMMGNLDNPNVYANLLKNLKSLKSSEFDFGLTHVYRDPLITETELTYRKIGLMNQRAQKKDLEAVSANLQTLAQEFQGQIGDQHLIIQEIFNNDTTVTGTSEFFNLMAVSYEALSDSVVWANPSQAAEYEQIAMGYRQQNGQSGSANDARVRAYSNTCRCWVCGRSASGEGIHFYSAPADISPALANESSAEGTNKNRAEDNKHIYICRACYSSISNRADEIAYGYHQKSMAEMRAMEARIQAQIAALEREISTVRMMSRS